MSKLISACLGATAYEIQCGAYWVRVLRPKCWFIPYRHLMSRKTIWPRFVSIQKVNT